MMGRIRTITTVLLLQVAVTAHALAAQPYKGDVKKVDTGAGKVTLTHGAIKKLDMEGGMTMTYRVADPAMLKGIAAGDKVTFDADKVDETYTVTKIEKAK